MGTSYRSGRSTALLAVGIGLVLPLGIGGGLILPVVLLLVTGEPATLLLLLLLPVAVIVGGVLAVIGYRTRIWIAPEAVSWRGAVGSPRTVPFAQIRQVEVPMGRRSPNPGVLLHLHSGAVVPITALKMSSGEDGTTADRGYRHVSAAVVEAHRVWWSSRRAPGRQPTGHR